MLGGFPLFAEGQTGAAYPINLLLYPWLKTWVAMNFSIVLHYLLAAAGMYLLMRRWVSEWPAALSAICYALNGWMVVHLVHLNAVSAAAWLPWVFYLLEKGRARGEEGRGERGEGMDSRFLVLILFTSVVLAMPFLAGHIQVALFICLAVVVYVATGLLFSSRLPPLSSLLLPLAAFGLAAVQLLPSRELLQLSDRAQEQGYDFLTYGSVPPSFLALFVVPRLFGSVANDTGWRELDLPFHEMSFYVGLLPLFFAAVALWKRRDRPTLFFGVLLVVSGVFILGKYTPLYHIHEWIPVFDRMRMPGRYAYLVVFALSALAGLGMDGRGGRREERGEEEGFAAIRNPQSAFVWAAAVVLLPLLAGLWVYRGFDASSELAERLKPELVHDVLRGVGFLVLSAGLLWCWLRKKFSWMPCAMVVLVAADLFIANRHLNLTIDPDYYEKPPATAQWLLERENPREFRIYDFDRRYHPTGMPGLAAIRNPKSAIFRERERLNGSIPMSYGLRTLDGHLGLYTDRWWAYDANISANRLGAMAVKYVVGEPPRDKQWFKKVADTPEPIYENLRFGPRAYVAKEIVLPMNMDAEEFVPGSTVMLEDVGELTGLPSVEFESAKVRFVVDDPDVVELEVEVVSNGQAEERFVLVLADTWFPGWEATVDGQDVPILRANFFYTRAVLVPAGKHVVRFEYRPVSFQLGLRISLITLALGVLVIVWRLKATIRP